ncbi:hypothetical protein CRP738_gp64 [Roseobacter phage CRP-738]|nr:hypothetical protein CRP738_gp64 [Roseobacter phage CRP-738]
MTKIDFEQSPQLRLRETNEQGVQMTLIANYPSKKVMKENIGQRLKYIETSLFGPEYKANGTLTVCNRPHITGQGREWFGQVTMKDGKITAVK